MGQAQAKDTSRFTSAKPPGHVGGESTIQYRGHEIAVFSVTTATGWTWAAAIDGVHSIEGEDGSLASEALAIAEGFAEAQNFIDAM